ncbi:hypothetical protein JQ608_38465 [Bradyrhizobium liaoningense]|uniref:hypothetical protein n=1 Tax=Bradyrhizobium liaoningense TaxID=43992 RepID=UPI001BAA3218|nr:hypothetical protein [Bradyrhizobium liaoningense]MBR0882909.1 hypothetical protein [Bradyrhizobium liaoningense]
MPKMHKIAKASGDAKLKSLQAAVERAADRLADALVDHAEDISEPREALDAARAALKEFEEHRTQVDAFVMAAAQAAEHHDVEGLRCYASAVEREIANLNAELDATRGKLRELTATPEERYWDDVIKRTTNGYGGFVAGSATSSRGARIYLRGTLHEDVFTRLKAEQEEIGGRLKSEGKKPAVCFQCPRVAGSSLELMARDTAHAIELLTEHGRVCADDDSFF